MTWLLIIAVLVVVLVGAAVLPRRASFRQQERTWSAGFPWFWVVFPVTCLCVAGAVAVWLPGSPSGGADFGWTMYIPLTDATEHSGPQLLSDRAAWNLLSGPFSRIVFPVLALVGAGLSTWSWRRGRL